MEFFNVMKSENIKNIQTFFSPAENETNLIINSINDSIDQFYLFIIKYFSSVHKINLRFNIKKNFDFSQTTDLFNQKIILVYKTTNVKDLKINLQNSSKKIILTDYKNFKWLKNNNLVVNSYNIQLDMQFFLREELNIKNKNLESFLNLYPEYAENEIDKFLLNPDSYVSPIVSNHNNNQIILLRRDFYKNKKNLLDLYKNLKYEVNYKKFSFLTY